MSARVRSRLTGLALGLAVFATALWIWDAWPRDEATAFYFPSAGEIGRTALDVWPSPEFRRAVGASLVRLAAGFGVGSLAGIAVGLALGASTLLRRTVGPTTEFLRAVPVIAVLPIAIVLLGDEDAMRIAVIAFGVFFPVFVATVDGVRGVSPEVRDIAALLRLGGVERSVRVQLPAALPTIFAGLRTALSIGLVLVVISELRGTGDGLGVYLWTQSSLFAFPEVYAGILFLGLLGFVLNTLFVVLERRVLAWHYGSIGERGR
jgi:ABC-type nitrate/sulfonate/bicarbonate transport system permease component